MESVQAPRYNTQEFLSQQNLTLVDETVAEVFGMMLGFAAEVIDSPQVDPHAGEQMEETAIVGFSGSMRGSCEVRLSSVSARSVASAMLGGAPIAANDPSIPDAVGEVCNMIAGGWKNRVPTLSSLCSLSPPTIISGRHYTVHIGTPSTKLSRTYRFDTHTFQLTVQCENSSAT